MSVLNKIKQYMEENDFTKADIARLSDIPYTTIDGIFKKGDENIKLTTLKKLAAMMGCRIDELVYTEPAVKAECENVTSNELEILDMLRALDDRGRSAVLDTLRREYEYTAKEKSDNGNMSVKAI